MTIGILRVIAIGVLVVCATAVVAAQDEAFKRGLRALDDKNWAEAAIHMRAAAAERPDEPRKVNRKWYAPNYYLGKAAYEAKDCIEALEAWAKVHPGIMKEERDFRNTVTNGERECIDKRGILRPSDYKNRRTSVDATYQDAQRLADRITTQADRYALWDAHPDWRNKYTEAYNRLKAAQDSLTRATETHLSAGFNTAESSVKAARPLLDELLQSVANEVKAIEAFNGRTGEVRGLMRAAAAAEAALADVPIELPENLEIARTDGNARLREAQALVDRAAKPRDMKTLDRAHLEAKTALSILRGVVAGAEEAVGLAVQTQADGIARALKNLEGRAGRAQKLLGERTASAPAGSSAQLKAVRGEIGRINTGLPAARDGQDLDALRQMQQATASLGVRIDALLRTFGPVTLRDRGVPDTLQRGADLFLIGEYEQVVRLFDDATLESFGRMAPHARLFQAAALHTMYLRSGGRDTALLDKAREAIGRVRADDPQLRPDNRVFNARFLQLFDTAATGAVPLQPAAVGR